jgi:hypothetical protein
MAHAEHYTPFTNKLQTSAPNRYSPSELRTEEMVLNIGPQHPCTQTTKTLILFEC